MGNLLSYVAVENHFYAPCFPHLQNGYGVIILTTACGCFEDHMHVNPYHSAPQS